MATVTTKVCDVCRKIIEGVETYRVRIMETGAAANEVPVDPQEDAKDLCPRDLERLKDKIFMGLRPPVKQKLKPEPTIETT